MSKNGRESSKEVIWNPKLYVKKWIMFGSYPDFAMREPKKIVLAMNEGDRVSGKNIG
jgi:hypothetical protein